MTIRLSRRTQAATLLILAATIFLTGCHSLASKKHGQIGDIRQLGDPSDAPVKKEHTCTVEVRGRWRSSQRVTVPLTGDMSVQEVLEKSGVLSWFGNMNIVVVRTNPDTGKAHKMRVDYSAGKRKVASPLDYTVMHGDRIIVGEDSTTEIDRLLAPLMGPLERFGLSM